MFFICEGSRMVREILRITTATGLEGRDERETAREGRSILKGGKSVTGKLI